MSRICDDSAFFVRGDLPGEKTKSVSEKYDEMIKEYLEKWAKEREEKNKQNELAENKETK